jgi:hypothetical protein
MTKLSRKKSEIEVGSDVVGNTQLSVVAVGSVAVFDARQRQIAWMMLFP